MNRRGLLLAGVIALVAGCGSEPSQTERADAPPSTASPSPDPSATASDADRHICETLIADAGPAYDWLSTLERERSISGDLDTPGYIDAYQLGGTIKALTSGEADSPDLELALQLLITEGGALRRAIDSQGAVSPTGLRAALERAADACADQQVPVGWRSS